MRQLLRVHLQTQARDARGAQDLACASGVERAAVDPDVCELREVADLRHHLADDLDVLLVVMLRWYDVRAHEGTNDVDRMVESGCDGEEATFLLDREAVATLRLDGRDAERREAIEARAREGTELFVTRRARRRD